MRLVILIFTNNNTKIFCGYYTFNDLWKAALGTNYNQFYLRHPHRWTLPETAKSWGRLITFFLSSSSSSSWSSFIRPLPRHETRDGMGWDSKCYMTSNTKDKWYYMYYVLLLINIGTRMLLRETTFLTNDVF